MLAWAHKASKPDTPCLLDAQQGQEIVGTIQEEIIDAVANGG